MTLYAEEHEARARLVAAGIAPEEAARDAELLARHVLGWDRATWLMRLRDAPPARFGEAYATAIARRVRREPVAYIRGTQAFWGRDFLVGPGVLIPRPETELIVEEALAWAATRPPGTPLRVVDVGTGSGCLAVTLALEWPAAAVSATDVSPEALTIAAGNARRFGASVHFSRGAVLAGAASPFDLVVSNPPYVTDAEYVSLQPEVKDYEPAGALAGGADGLDVVRAVIAAAARTLAPGGLVLIEIGAGQAEHAAGIVADTGGLQILRVRHDLGGIGRVLVARAAGLAPTSSG